MKAVLDADITLSAEEKARQLAPFNVGWWKIKAKLKDLQSRLEKAERKNDSADMKQAQSEMNEQMDMLQVVTLAMFDDMCKILNGLYQNPDSIPGFEIPTSDTPQDFIWFLALALPRDKWQNVKDDLLDDSMLRIAKANLHPDGKGDVIVEDEEQQSISGRFNNSIDNTCEWMETATFGEKMRLFQDWTNVKKIVESAFVANSQRQSAY